MKRVWWNCCIEKRGLKAGWEEGGWRTGDAGGRVGAAIVLRRELPPPQEASALARLWRDELAGQVRATCRKGLSGALRQRSCFRVVRDFVKVKSYSLTPASLIFTSPLRNRCSPLCCRPLSPDGLLMKRDQPVPRASSPFKTPNDLAKNSCAARRTALCCFS